MKRFHSLATALATAAVFAAVFAGCPKQQTVADERDYTRKVTVAPTGKADYRTIGEALDAARDGWLIEVRTGVYEEEVKVETDEVTLRGAGPGKAVIDASGEYAALTVDADDVAVEGFTLRGAESHGAYVKGEDAVIRRCLIAGNGDRGIYFSFMGGEPSGAIDHCTIAGNKVSGLYIPNQNDATSITNCIIADNNRGIVCDKNTGEMKVDYNCLDNEEGDYSGVSAGKHDVQKSPKFSDPDGGDYTLKKSSPCIGTARDGGNIGCF
jgi:nitrous oxidase accessory protein NosD